MMAGGVCDRTVAHKQHPRNLPVLFSYPTQGRQSFRKLPWEIPGSADKVERKARVRTRHRQRHSQEADTLR